MLAAWQVTRGWLQLDAGIAGNSLTGNDFREHLFRVVINSTESHPAGCQGIIP
jgi:hypothetical protein